MLQTPVLLLIFNRPDTTERVFSAIRQAKPTQLFVAADGPRPDRPGEKETCIKSRSIVLKNIDWDCEVQTLLREENLGCGIGVSSAITWFFEHVEAGIILEDDCLPNQSFFQFCEQLLQYYNHEPRLMHISGNNFQNGKKWGNSAYYFSQYINAWGWATWRRAWNLYQYNIVNVDFKKLSEFFQKNNFPQREVDYWYATFKTMTQIDTWDFQWVYTCWVNNGLSVYPNVNLVSNIGFGANATHTFDESSKVANHLAFDLKEISHPAEIKLYPQAERRLFEYCHIPQLSLRDKAYLAKEKLKRIAKALSLKTGKIK